MNLNLLGIFVIGMNQLVLMAILQNDSNLETADCIAQVVHLVGERKVAIEFAENHQDLAFEVLRKIMVPVVINSRETRRPSGIDYRTSNDLVLLLKHVDPEMVSKNTLWNGHTRFLIVSPDEKKIEKYFQNFWKLKIINVFAMVLNKGKVFVYSFLPYKRDNCDMLELITVDTCLEGRLKEGGLAFKDSMRIKNMQGCPVNITVTDARPNVIFEPDEGYNKSSSIKGFEGNLMEEVAKILNFKITYKLPEDGIGWGWIYPSPHGTVGDVYLGVSDLAIGMLGPLLDRYENLDFSTNYCMDECVTFGVPQGYGAKKSTWITIFVLEFTFSTWTLITFSFVLISINIWLINRYLNINWFASKTEMFLFIFSSYLGIPVKTPDYLSAKTSVIFWIFFSFTITVAYKASMGSKLAVPPRDPDINTFEELVKTDLELTGFKTMYQLLQTTDDWAFRRMRKKYHFANYTLEYMVDRIANGDKIAHLRHKTTFYYYSLINLKARGRIHLLSDCVYLYHPIVMARKFSPFINKVSQTVSRLEESGIMNMWRTEYMKKLPKPSKPFFKLSFEQMFGIFCCLGLGYVVALLSFLYEICFSSEIPKSRPFLFHLLSLGCRKFCRKKVPALRGAQKALRYRHGRLHNLKKGI